jgi:serine/threonine-protein kinase RsbW
VKGRLSHTLGVESQERRDPTGVAVERRSFEACADSVPEVRHAVVGWAGERRVSQETLQAVALAVTEAAANVVVHAYRDRNGQGEIHIELAVDEEGLRVSVLDTGVGMAPRPDSPGLGMGMPLIATLAERVEVRSPDAGGTEVCMRFAVPELCCAG